MNDSDTASVDAAHVGRPEYSLRFVRLDASRDGATVGVALPDTEMSAPRGGAIGHDGRSVLPLRHVIGVGRNYKAHADEQGAALPERPMLFTKNPAACCLSGDAVVIPRACADHDQVDYEGELAVVIGRACRDVAERDVLNADLSPVLGVCVANDVSARWWQKQGSGGQFNRGKSFDTFCPLGPWLTPLRRAGDLRSLAICTRLNGETVQSATTGQMIFSVPHLVAECARGTTLLPGTVLLTGTPAGVGMARTPPRFLRDGDVVEVEIGGLGVLRNAVRSE